DDQVFLDPLRGRVARLELEEVVPTVAVERGASRGEPQPERVLGTAVDARTRVLSGLPPAQALAQRLARLLPLHALGVAGGDRLGLLDERRASGERLLLRGGAGRLGDRATLGGHLSQGVEPRAELGEVADGGRFGGLFPQLLE